MGDYFHSIQGGPIRGAQNADPSDFQCSRSASAPPQFGPTISLAALAASLASTTGSADSPLNVTPTAFLADCASFTPSPRSTIARQSGKRSSSRRSSHSSASGLSSGIGSPLMHGDEDSEIDDNDNDDEDMDEETDGEEDGEEDSHSSINTTSNPLSVVTVERRRSLKFADIAPYFHVPLKQAAALLTCSTSGLKKKCRAVGLKRWPYRKINSLEKKISHLEELLPKTNFYTRTKITRKIEKLRNEIHAIKRDGNSGGSSKRRHDLDLSGLSEQTSIISEFDDTSLSGHAPQSTVNHRRDSAAPHPLIGTLENTLHYFPSPSPIPPQSAPSLFPLGNTAQLLQQLAPLYVGSGHSSLSALHRFPELSQLIGGPTFNANVEAEHQSNASSRLLQDTLRALCNRAGNGTSVAALSSDPSTVPSSNNESPQSPIPSHPAQQQQQPNSVVAWSNFLSAPSNEGPLNSVSLGDHIEYLQYSELPRTPTSISEGTYCYYGRRPSHKSLPIDVADTVAQAAREYTGGSSSHVIDGSALQNQQIQLGSRQLQSALQQQQPQPQTQSQQQQQPPVLNDLSNSMQSSPSQLSIMPDLSLFKEEDSLDICIEPKDWRESSDWGSSLF